MRRHEPPYVEDASRWIAGRSLSHDLKLPNYCILSVKGTHENGPAHAQAGGKQRPSGRGVEGLTLGYWPGPLFEVFFVISSPVMFGDSLEVRDVAMPHGVNTIGLKQGF